MSELYKKVEDFVTDAFTKEGVVDHSVKHLQRTADWVKELEPDADEALLIAALGHDIHRATAEFMELKAKRSGFKDPEYDKIHQEGGAEIVCEFLKKEKADSDLIDRVRMLISVHEVGGNEDQNILKDADSISFFENNIPVFITKKVKETNKEKVREKFDWMYERITSEKAKEIAKPMYEEAIKRLEAV